MSARMSRSSSTKAMVAIRPSPSRFGHSSDKARLKYGVRGGQCSPGADGGGIGRQRDELVTKLFRRRGGRQHVIPEALAQGDLLDLAGSGMGDLVDDHDVVGHP